MQIARYIQDNLVALTVKLVYTATLPIDKYPRECSFTLGWDTILPSLNQEGKLHDQKVDLFLNLGPGSSLMKDVLWGNSKGDADAQSFQLRITADLGTAKTAPAPSHVEPLQDRLMNQKLALNDIRTPSRFAQPQQPAPSEYAQSYNNKTSGQQPASVHYSYQPSAANPNFPTQQPIQPQYGETSGIPGRASQFTG